MVDVIHKTTMIFYRSVNTPDYPTGTYLHSPIFDPDEATILAVTPAWRKITGGDTVEEMTAGEKLDNPLPGVDAPCSNSYKDPVRAVTTAALAAHTRSGSVLTASANGAFPAQDGVTLTANQRLLVKNEGSGTHLENGVYILATVGDGTHPWKLQRSFDCDSNNCVCCCLTLKVQEGTVNAGKKFTLTTTGPITLNETALTFALIENVLQQKTKQSGAVATGTTLIPGDDSIPTKTEGDERLVMDPFTPKSAKSKLRIEGKFFLASTCEDPLYLIAAVFKDDDTPSIGGGALDSNYEFPLVCVPFSFEVASGSTTARTYKVRCGGSAAGTTTFNGVGGSRLLGGVLYSSITVTEIG